MTTKRDRAAAAAFFYGQPPWDLVLDHWIETGEKRYGATHLARPDVIALADAFAAHAAGEVGRSASSSSPSKRGCAWPTPAPAPCATWQTRRTDPRSKGTLPSGQLRWNRLMQPCGPTRP
jgi:hypothetical protein